MTAATGLVSIVGAGPGDPGLLTRAALARLRRADLVLFDALVSPETLALARRARRFSVGKRAGRPSMRQETIHALMIRAARRGQRVVRLKGGDPFVFGRGGEEALALRAAGIAFEVDPRRQRRDRRAGAGRHPGDASRRGVRLHRRLGSRRVGVRAGARRDAPGRRDARAADGGRDAGRDRRARSSRAAGRRPRPRRSSSPPRAATARSGRARSRSLRQAMARTIPIAPARSSSATS